MITLINHQGLKLIEGIQIQTPAPPIGLAYIGAYLKKNGYSYTAVDACGEALDQIRSSEFNENIKIQGLTIPEIIQRIPSHTKIIGFTCSFSHCWPLVVNNAEAIREKFPDAVFVAGGEHPTALPEQVLKNGLFDIVVQREGEETFIELAEKILNNKPWHDISGIIYMDKGKQLVTNKPRTRVADINKFPSPDWDSWCIEDYIKCGQVAGINLGSSMPILGSRGCPYMCTFCSNECMWTRHYIMRDPKSIVDEMEHMVKKYKVNGFTFFDSTFIINRKKTLVFCQELIKRNLNIIYQLPAGTRCEVINDELAYALEESGLRNFSFAAESGSEKIRDVINKQINIDNLFKAVKSVKKTNMTVGCFMVLGFPEDDHDTMHETLSLVQQLALKGVDDVTVSKFTPYPCSDYYNNLYEKGFFSEKHEELNNIISFFSGDGPSYCNSLTTKQTYRWMKRMYINFYLTSFIARPWKVAKNFWIYFSKGVETTRYMRFFSEIFYNRSRWKRTVSVND